MSVEELSLGVLFRGRTDATFEQAASRVQTVLSSLNKTVGTSTKATGDLSSSSKKAANDMDIVGKKISKVSGTYERFAAAVKVTASYGLAAKAIFTVVNAFSEGTQTIIDHNQALKNLQAIVGSTEAELAAMDVVIRKVGASTRYSAVEAADAAVILGQAGLETTEIMDALGAVANLATGTLASMSDAADLVTTALTAFNLESSKSAAISDVFATAINKSKLNMDKLRTSFNYVGPVANLVGLSLEETVASMELLANAGLRGSTIGTGLRRVLQLLVAPSEKLKVLFKATGVDLDKINPAIAEMSDVIAELNNILGDNVDSFEAAERAFKLFGPRAASAAAALALGGPQDYLERLDGLLLSVGASSDMAKIQMEGLGVMLKNLSDKAKDVAISLGEGGFADALATLVPLLGSVLDLISKLADTTGGRMVVALISLTAVLSATAASFKFLTLMILSLSLSYPIAEIKRMIAAEGLLTNANFALALSFDKLKTSILTHPLFWIPAAIAAIVTVTYSLIKAKKQHIENLEKEAIAANKTYNTLSSYAKELKNAEEGSTKHKAALIRLAQEYDELAIYIDTVNGKLREGGKEAIDRFLSDRAIETLKADLDVVKGLYAQINNLENKRLISEKATTAEASKFEKLMLGVSDKKMRKVNEELENSKDSVKAYTEVVAEMLKTMGVDTSSNKDEIISFLSEYTTMAESSMNQLAAAIVTYNKKIEDANNRIVKPENLLSDQMDVLTTADNRFVSLYGRLSELRQADLLEVAQDLNEKIEKFEQSAEAKLLSESQVKAKIQNMRDEAYRKFVETETTKQKASRTAKEQAILFIEEQIAKERELEKQKLRTEKIGLVKKLQSADFEDEKEREKMLLALEEALQRKLKEVDTKYDLEEAEQRLKIREELIDQELEKEKQGMIKRGETTKEIENWIREAKIDALEEYVDVYQSNYDRIKEIYGENHKETLEAEKKLQAAKTDLSKANTDDLEEDLNEYNEKEKEALKARLKNVFAYSVEWKAIIDELYKKDYITKEEYVSNLNKAFEDTFDSIEEGYKLGVISQEDYLKALKKHYEILGKSEREYQEALEEVTGTWIDGIKRGFREVAKESKTVVQLVTNAVKTSIDSLRSTFSTFLSDFILGEGGFASFDDSSIKSAKVNAEAAQEAYESLETATENYYQSLNGLEGEALAAANERYFEMVEERNRAYQEYAQSKNALEEEISAKEKEELDNRLSYVRNFLKSVLNAIIDMIAQKAVQSFIGMFGSSVASPFAPSTVPSTPSISFVHGGGTIGESLLPRKKIDPSIFSFAPRLHSGLRSDEFPAILQRGETVTPKDKNVTPNITINIDNRTGNEVKVTKQNVKFNIKEMILGIVIEGYSNNFMNMRQLMNG